MKNPTTPDIYRMIRTAAILAVSSQARLSEAPGRGATRAGVVSRSLDRSAIVCQGPHRRTASRATTPPYHHSVVQQYPVMAKKRSSSHACGTSGLAPTSDVPSAMFVFRLIASVSPPAPDVADIPGERLSLTRLRHCNRFGVRSLWEQLVATQAAKEMFISRLVSVGTPSGHPRQVFRIDGPAPVE